MSFSYWEQKTWLSNIDFTVIGSGITGLSCALQLRKKYPGAKILVLERGILPNGASTKNAGFACFGSLSEIIDDLQTHTEQEVFDLVSRRTEGLQLLKSTLGDQSIKYKQYGGYELFLKEDVSLFEDCNSKLEYINELLKPVFKEDVFSIAKDTFGFKKVIQNYIFNKFEGQIDTGAMMQSLLYKVYKENIQILNSCEVEEFYDQGENAIVKTKNFEFTTAKIFIATNGFATKLGINEVRPARAQVIITAPINNLDIKGTFHLDKGYYYFRNIDNRILFGGGRNLDFKAEETTEMNQTSLVQDKLEEILKEVILPNKKFKIDQRWSGIMGVGTQKKPIITQLSENVYCGVRLGGMGVAIGSLAGRELADLLA